VRYFNLVATFSESVSAALSLIADFPALRVAAFALRAQVEVNSVIAS
jgi:hypothetical protein